MPRRRRTNGTAFVPNDDQRGTVKAMAAVGIPHDDIAKCLDIAPKTLRKHFRPELDLSMTKANATVAGALYTLATTPGPGQATAAIFWMKTRMGWSETQKHEVTGKDGEPLLEVRRIERIIIRRGDKAREKAAGAENNSKANARPAARPIHAKNRNS